MSEPVVVTGIGVVGGFGVGVEALDAALRADEPRTVEIDASAGYHRPGGARRASLVDTSELSALLSPAQARRMTPPSRFAVAAVRLAVEDAALALDDPALAETAIVFGTGFGPAWVTERLMTSILAQGPETASPALFTEAVANAAAAQAAIAIQARGPNLTITQREASGLLAFAEGARLVASGRAALALVGAVDEMPPLLHSILDRFGALARRDTEGREVARPFDRRRNGVVAGEGAAVLVLEPARRAAARRARIYARVEAVGAAFDATAGAAGWGHGELRLADALRGSLARKGLTPANCDRIVAGAAGSRHGDRLEGAMLRALFAGETPPPVLVPKATLGEFGGGALAAAAWLASGGAGAGAADFGEVDPEIGIRPRPASRRDKPRRTLATAVASGGAAAWAVLAAPE